MAFSAPLPPRRPRAQRADETIDASRHLASALLEDAEIAVKDPRYARERRPQLARRTGFADVEHTVERYASQADALIRNHLPTPVLFSPEQPVGPIDIGLPPLPAEQREYGAAYPAPLVGILLDAALSRHSPSGSVEVMSAGESQDLVIRGLSDFLAARIDNGAGPVHDGDAMDAASSYAPLGYPFTVSTAKTPRCRIHYSPAYFVNRNLVFGGALSTVTGVLMPGRYTFGAYSTVDGSSHWDGAEYDVPDITSSARIDF